MKDYVNITLFQKQSSLWSKNNGKSPKSDRYNSKYHFCLLISFHQIEDEVNAKISLIFILKWEREKNSILSYNQKAGNTLPIPFQYMEK